MSQGSLIIPDGIKAYSGEPKLLGMRKLGFVSSNKLYDGFAERCDSWLTRLLRENSCVVSGFLSKPEKLVLERALALGVPVIWVLACGIESKGNYLRYKKAEADCKLLRLALFDNSVTTEIRENSYTRNQYVLGLSDCVYAGEVLSGSMTERLLTGRCYSLI